MLVTIFSSIMPLAFAVLVGFLMGRALRPAAIHWASQALTPVVWGILWVIGISTGATLSSFEQGLHSLKLGALFAVATSLCTLLLLAPFCRPNTGQSQRAWWQNLIHPLQQASIAFALVGLGILCYHLNWQQSVVAEWLFNIHYWLLLLLWLIGIELTQVRFSRAWLAWPILRIPVFTIFASLLAGALISMLSSIQWPIALALSSGFGWFSLSGALASQHLGENYGAIALLTDLLRELLGILAVFVLGPRFNAASIGICGATAADTTLPFIRQVCGRELIPAALMTGLVLTLTGPFLMLFFMKLALPT